MQSRQVEYEGSRATSKGESPVLFAEGRTTVRLHTCAFAKKYHVNFVPGRSEEKTWYSPMVALRTPPRQSSVEPSPTRRSEAMERQPTTSPGEKQKVDCGCFAFASSQTKAVRLTVLKF